MTKESAPNIITPLEDLKSVEAAVKEDSNLPIEIIKRTETGSKDKVYEAQLEGKIIFVRQCRDLRQLETEILGYEIFRKQGVPVPIIIKALPNPPRIKKPTIFLSAAEGTSIKETNISDEQKDTIYEELGEIVKKIHEVKLEGFGQPKVIHEKLVGQFTNNEDYRKSHERRINEAIDFLFSKELINNEQREKMRRTMDELKLLNFGQASLLHADLGKNHIFVKENKVTGIIDLGAIHVGDPRYDIAVCFYKQNEREREAFGRGYGELADDPVVKKYMLEITAVKMVKNFRNDQKIDQARLNLLHKILSEI